MNGTPGPLRIGLRVPPCQPVDVLISTVVEAEQAGFDDLWFPDSQLLWRDVFCVLTAAALRTDSIRLGTAVTNVVTRHPSVLASAARTIAEIQPGRFRLGLGVGNSSLLPIGLAASTQQEMRSAVTMVRTLLRGEEYAFGGRRSRLRDPGGNVPIYLAATGPRNLRLAGELADGVILLSGVAPAGLARATNLVGEGVAASGRSTQDVDLVVSAYCHVTDDIERDARMLKPVCAAMAQNGGTQFLRAAGIDIEVPSDVPQVYPDLAHAEDWKQAVDITSRWVSDADAVRFADAFCLFGTGEQIAARLLATQRAGATSVFLQHVGSYDVPAELLQAVSREVLPRLPVAVR